MRLYITIGLIFVFALSFGQGRETREVREFIDINIQGPFKVKLKQGSESRLEIDSDMIPLDEIITDVSGKELTMKLKSRVYLKEKYYDSDYIHVEITYQQLEELKASMGSQVRVYETLDQDYLRVESSMGAEIEMKVNVIEFYGRASMGGIADLSGKADFAEISASMGGEFHGILLNTNRSDIRSGMGGVVSISTSERLNGSASMGGVIRYAGDPVRKNTNTSLGGEIRRDRKNN